MKLPSLTADSASEFRRLPNKFTRLPNRFSRSSNLIPTVPVGGDIKGTVLVRISTTAAPTLTKEASATASVSINASAKGHYTYFAIADVTISATAAGQRTAGGTANIGVDITSTADGNVFTAHSGVATVGVTIEATAAAATGTTHSSSTADCQVNISASANGFNISDTIPDETANGNNMVMEGTGWTFETDAAVGTRSVDFGNSNNTYGIIDESYLSVFRSPWSFSCWYKPDNGYIATTGGGTSILYLLHTGINGTTGGSHYQMYHHSRKLRWWSRIDLDGASTLCDTTNNVFSSGSGTNDWVHIVVTVDNVGNPTMYLDGSETTLNTDSTPNTLNISNYSNTSDVRIGLGRTGSSEGYKIDDVSIWSTELTSTQVSNLYNSGSGTDLTGSSNLAGWWKMGDSNVVPVTHTGTATVSVDVTTSASGNAISTHSGVASIQVNLSASAGASSYDPLTEVPDESGENNVMTLNGATFSSTAAIGSKSVDFDGTNDYTQVDDTFQSLIRSSNFSISAWVQFDTANNTAPIISISDSTANNNRLQFYRTNTNYIQFSIVSDGDSRFLPTATGTLTGASTWFHIVATVGSNNNNYPDFKAYIDGSLSQERTDQDFQPIDLSQYTSSVKLEAGRLINQGGSYYLNGRIDDISIWDKELSSTEVSNLYNSGSGTDLSGSSNLVGWWKMGDSNIITHSGTASCQVNLSASASGTVTSPDYEQEVSEITSLKGWFDANKPNGTDQTGFTNGTAVTTWTSRVGTSVTLGQSTASAKPTWNTSQINSLPAINFDVGDWLNSTSTDIKDIVHGQNNIAITTYVVMQVDNYPSSSGAGDAMVLGWEDTVTSVGSQDVFHLPRIERGTGYLQLLERAGGTGLTNLAGYEYQTAIGTGSYKYFGCIAGATSITLRVNGSEQTMSNYLGGTWNTAQTHDAHQLQVGGFSNAGGSQLLLDGKIAEILIFNSTLGSTDIASVENYITDKYNL